MSTPSVEERAGAAHQSGGRTAPASRASRRTPPPPPMHGLMSSPNALSTPKTEPDPCLRTPSLPSTTTPAPALAAEDRAASTPLPEAPSGTTRPGRISSAKARLYKARLSPRSHPSLLQPYSIPRISRAPKARSQTRRVSRVRSPQAIDDATPTPTPSQRAPRAGSAGVARLDWAIQAVRETPLPSRWPPSSDHCPPGRYPPSASSSTLPARSASPARTLTRAVSWAETPAYDAGTGIQTDACQPASLGMISSDAGEACEAAGEASSRGSSRAGMPRRVGSAGVLRPLSSGQPAEPSSAPSSRAVSKLRRAVSASSLRSSSAGDSAVSEPGSMAVLHPLREKEVSDSRHLC